MRRSFKNTALLISAVFALAVLVVDRTYSYYQDSATSTDNSLDAISLDMEFDSDEESFEPDEEFNPGTVLNRTGYVKNVGQLPFIYSQEYQFVDGSSELCSELNLQVIYEYDDNGDTEEIEKYNGPLTDFNITGETDDDLQHPNDTTGEDPHKYKYKITVPLDLDEDLADETCNFDILASAWMEEFEVGQAYWDQEVLSQGLTTKEYDEPIACEVGETILAIGDIEDDQEDNPVDEFNWPGEFGEFPDFPDPFKVGINDEDEFPWNSNHDEDYATDFDIEFFNPYEESKVALKIGWSPGKSDDEQKEVFYDGDSIGTTPVRNGTLVSGWWEEMERFEDELEFVLGNGHQTLNMQHLMGDGTLWDYIRIETVACGLEEGDIIINEVMWGGSGLNGKGHERDEWIELKNTTDEDVDLTGWVIERAGQGPNDIELDGIIPANGYYLLSVYDSDHDQGGTNKSSLHDDNVNVDLIDFDIHIRDQGEQLILKDTVGNEIDKTPEATGSDGWATGEDSPGDSEGEDGTWKSMERKDGTEDAGDDENSWEDGEDNSDTYWDENDGENYGTPGDENDA